MALKPTRCRSFLSPLLLALLCLGLSEATNLCAAEPETSNLSGLRGEVLWQLHDTESKLTQLAEAFPSSRLNWRPTAGVRSTGDVLAHVASSNYYYPSLWGAKPPGSVDTENGKFPSDRVRAIAAVQASFVYIQEQIAALNDTDLDRQVNMSGRKLTIRALLLHAVTHAHEHLGQTIAYARMNGVVPPWSKKEN